MNLPKQAPQSIESEQSVLGGLMIDNTTFDSVAELLTSEDFFRTDHRILFEAIARLIGQNKPADFITLNELLRSTGELEAVGGFPYLGQLAADTPGTANILAYAEIVRERSLLRQIAAAGELAVAMAYRPDGRSVEKLLDALDQRVFSIRSRGAASTRESRPIRSFIPEVVSQIELAAQSAESGGVMGLSTGFKELDEMTTGLKPGDLVVIAARPSMGKTSLAMNIAEHVAITLAKPALMFSLEMSGEQLALRVLSSAGRVPQQTLRNGRLSDHDWRSLVDVVGLLDKAPLFIDDAVPMTLMDLKARARRIARRQPLSLIVIDYLQLMQSGRSSENRTNEIADISRGLKILAKELALPVIVLSQLNRSVEKRDSTEPRLSDLRDSGAIEQDADIVMFIDRERKPNAGLEAFVSQEAKVIIAKHRNGPIGAIDVKFFGAFSRFE